MHQIRRTSVRALVTLFLALFLVVGSAAADDGASVGEQIGNAGEVVFDVLILRPLGAAATAGGFGCFLLTAPFLAPTWEIPYGWDTFVMGPYDYTVERSLGDF